jgi:branched-chain amino acid transport system permease protein
MLPLTLQALYSGLLIGGSYALIALGLALVFGTMRLINLAHGELVLLAAYIAYEMERGHGINALAAIPVAMVIVGMVALMTYAAIARLRRDRELNSLILTFGLALVLSNLILIRWSADIRSTANGWFQEGVVIGGTLFSARSEILFFLVGAVVLAVVYLWLARTWSGRALRAVASNREAATLMGINPARVEALSFAIAGLLASIAGVALYTTSVVYPALGDALTVKAFVITVLAGLGSVPGVIVGAVMLGVAESLTATYLKPSLQELVAMVIFLAVLFVKPSGLFGRSNVVRR